jgi:hypothetical protein
LTLRSRKRIRTAAHHRRASASAAGPPCAFRLRAEARLETELAAAPARKRQNAARQSGRRFL